MDKRTVLSIIADESRYNIIKMLLEYERLNVSELMALTKLKQANTSRHLRILSKHGIVVSKKETHYIYYMLRKDFLNQHMQLIKYIMI